jgi:hypothetical protein
MEYIVVLVTSYFRFLASAPKGAQAGAGAAALEQGPKPIYRQIGSVTCM